MFFVNISGLQKDYRLLSHLPGTKLQGFSVILNIVDSSDEELFVTDIEVPNADLENTRALKETEIEINASGEFKIIITNNCPDYSSAISSSDIPVNSVII